MNFGNFFKATVADWHRCEVPYRDPDHVSFSGSAYWHLGDKVRRLSNHWGKVATCKWLLDGKRLQVYLCGECYYEDFRFLKKVYVEEFLIDEETKMIPVDDGQPCTCSCHKGEHLYHVILKPCCNKPIQGGKEKSVFVVDDNLVIASSQEEAEKSYKLLGE